MGIRTAKDKDVAMNSRTMKKSLDKTISIGSKKKKKRKKKEKEKEDGMMKTCVALQC